MHMVHDIHSVFVSGNPMTRRWPVSRQHAKQLIEYDKLQWNLGEFLVAMKTIIVADQCNCSSLHAIVRDSIAAYCVDLGFRRLCEKARSKVTRDFVIIDRAHNILSMLYTCGGLSLRIWIIVKKPVKPYEARNVTYYKTLRQACIGALK